MSNDLEELRLDIDKIDSEIVDIISRRMEIVDKILDFKKESGKGVRDRKREKKVIEKCFESSESRYTYRYLLL